VVGPVSELDLFGGNGAKRIEMDRLLQFAPLRRPAWWLAAAVVNALLLFVAVADVRAGGLAGAREKRASRRPSQTGMPSLALFGRDAVSFDEAWVPVPWTVPSHFAMLTGVDPWRVPFDGRIAAVRRRYADYRPRFRARGNATAAIMGNLTLSPESGFGRGFDEFTTSRGSGVCRSAAGDLLSRLWLHDLPRSPVCG
jgi:hypothetical protein